jgi:hypothetical protein
VKPPTRKADKKRNGHRRQRESDQPHGNLEQRRFRRDPASGQAQSEDGQTKGGDDQHRLQRAAHQARRTVDAYAEPYGDRREQRRGQKLAQWTHDVLHERRLRADDHERVVRAAGVTRRRGSRERVGLDEQGGGQKEDHDDKRRRARQQSIRAPGQAPGREGENDIDEPSLDKPARDPAHAVENLVA